MKAAGILVVEPQPDAQWRLARALTIAGHRVVGTSSAQGALALVRQWKVDLVLLAEDVDGTDGVELARSLREVRPGMKIVMLGEDTSLERSVEVRQAGIHELVGRPQSNHRLNAIVGRHLPHRVRQRSLTPVSIPRVS